MTYVASQKHQIYLVKLLKNSYYVASRMRQFLVLRCGIFPQLRFLQNFIAMSRPKCSMASIRPFLLLLNKHHTHNLPNPISNLKPYHRPHSNKLHYVYIFKQYILRQPIKINCYSFTLFQIALIIPNQYNSINQQLLSIQS